MKLFTCKKCSNLLYFENSICLSCGYAVGFDAASLDLLTLEVENGGSAFVDLTSPHSRFRVCQNAVHGTCNWLIPWDNPSTFCVACQLNRTIPTLTPQNRERWERIEIAKHRLIYSLLRLKLPFKPKQENEGVAFDFLADNMQEDRVMTGHDKGVITLNIEEADEAQRVRHKLDLGEKYRTLLGHFRHEIGHYYWEVLINNQPSITSFRALFGDETFDYSEALKNYYVNGPPPNWSTDFISPYASAHPWEDWAESWSHYMHLMDTLETAYYFGLRVNPGLQTHSINMRTIIRDPYTIESFQEVVEGWLPLTFAVNSLNRSMGHADFYPFLIAPNVVHKLQFIHDMCREKV